MAVPPELRYWNAVVGDPTDHGGGGGAAGNNRLCSIHDGGADRQAGANRLGPPGADRRAGRLATGGIEHPARHRNSIVVLITVPPESCWTPLLLIVVPIAVPPASTS